MNAELTRLREENKRLRSDVIALLTEIMHEDSAYVVGGPQALDKLAWAVARRTPDLPPELSQYLRPREQK
jgi:hypothetical protein